MKLITRDTDYAVRTLCFMAQSKEGIISASALVKELKIPRPFLRKILYVLNKKGIVKSFKGQHGGFQLASAPHKILLLDLMEIFQGPFRLNKCIFRKRVCFEKNLCLLRKKIQAIEQRLSLKLKSITIKSLI